MKNTPCQRLCVPAAAFTLVELLTVIAIIGILAAIIIPTVGKVRESARVTRSVGNLKSIGQAVQLYLADNKDRFPPLGQGTGFTAPLWTDTGLNDPDWKKGLNAYLPTTGRRRFVDYKGTEYSINEVYVDPMLAADRHHNAGDYGANNQIFKRDGSEIALNQIENSPSRLVLVATAETITFTPPIGSWFLETYNWVHGQSPMNNPPSDRGRGKVPVVFVDGHVEQLSKARLDSDQTYRRSLFLIKP